MTKKFKPTKRNMVEVIESMQKSFLENNPSLLTEEEAVKCVDDIRAELRKKGELNYENKNLCSS